MGCGASKDGNFIHMDDSDFRDYDVKKGLTVDSPMTPLTSRSTPSDKRRMRKLAIEWETDAGVEKSSKGAFQGLTVGTDTLKKFMDLEREVQYFEKRNVIESYQVKAEQMEQMEWAIQQLEAAQNELEDHILKLQETQENNGKQSLKNYLLQKVKGEGKLSKVEEDIVDALNRQEIIQRELDSTIQQRNKLKKEVFNLSGEGEKLQQVYKQRDEFLDVVFGGEYGSEKENQLERELDSLQERKQHIDQAHYKWKQASQMIKQASTQLGVAVQKWRRITNISDSDTEKMYYTAAESRNNLVAALQNIQGAHRYLPNVVFPYCTAEEMESVAKAITFVFTDMQTAERYEHALGCYHTTYRRAAALKQWFDQVLSTTIARDLSEMSEEVKAKSADLRWERIRLIREKVKEVTGVDVNLDDEDNELDSELDDALADEQVAQVFEAERIRNRAVSRFGAESRLTILPTPLPMADLAPMPSDEIIFGKIDELHREHKSQMEIFCKAQAMNHARMAQGLREKLQERRNQRNQRMIQEREIKHLTPTEKDSF